MGQRVRSTFLRANFSLLCANVPINVPMFQRHANFSTIFQKNWKIVQAWSLKPYQPKTSDIVFNGTRGINQIRASVKRNRKFFYLPNFTRCV